ncbi:hypothetical protein RJT34_07106 [Clitoria ternatea]|uniref:Uncharacterized protein n=1 Tax=Clitoria ternatea TaxID=43366 RepID=A0AAN9PS24_CLITE
MPFSFFIIFLLRSIRLCWIWRCLNRNSWRRFNSFYLTRFRCMLVGLNELMESKGGKKKSSSSSKSLFYEAPLGYSIEDVRPNGGIKKFRSAAYSNCARKPS